MAQRALQKRCQHTQRPRPRQYRGASLVVHSPACHSEPHGAGECSTGDVQEGKQCAVRTRSMSMLFEALRGGEGLMMCRARPLGFFQESVGSRLSPLEISASSEAYYYFFVMYLV